MNLANIPAELRQYPQWIAWRYEDRGGPKPTKLPINVRTGYPAAVDNPADWTDFDAVANAFAAGWVSGIGFVLTEHDPYTFIDLDDPQGDDATILRFGKIVDTFNTYTETSPSGKGVHLIVKGRVPNGKKKYGVEVYSSLRYMTMTGDVVIGSDIETRQGFLDVLWNELGGADQSANDAYDKPERESDHAIYQRAANAENGARFVELWNGSFNDYPSQSEADQALFNFLGFYSDNREQITRLFRMSGLGQRDKAKRNDYVERCISKAFDLKLADDHVEALRQELVEILEKRAAGNVGVGENTSAQPAASNMHSVPNYAQFSLMQPIAEVNRPPGLLGEIAQWILDQAPRPIAEVALVGGIGLMAGICGQAFNISNTGLNQYIMFLAPTGTGKEAIHSGISSLMTLVTGDLRNSEGKMTVDGVPAAAQFMGPAEIQSAPALLKRLQKASSFVTIIGEVGLLMKKWCHENANSNDMMIKRALLDLYSKSGRGQVVREMIYSKNENNTDLVHAPAVTIVGETVPETFLDVVDEHLVAQGLLPRFLIMEYRGPRVPLSKTYTTASPSEALVQRVRQLCAFCLSKMHDRQPVNVMVDEKATEFIALFDIFCDTQINSSNREIIKHLWNRAHLKLLRLSALVAVGCNPFAPVVSLEHAQWAYSLIVNDINTMLGRFERGEVGRQVHENTKQDETLLKILRDYVNGPASEVVKYGATEVQHFSKTIPYLYIQRRLVASSHFRRDKMGATAAIKRSLQSLIDAGQVAEFLADKHLNAKRSGARMFVLTKLGLEG